MIYWNLSPILPGVRHYFVSTWMIYSEFCETNYFTFRPWSTGVEAREVASGMLIQRQGSFSFLQIAVLLKPPYKRKEQTTAQGIKLDISSLRLIQTITFPNSSSYRLLVDPLYYASAKKNFCRTPINPEVWINTTLEKLNSTVPVTSASE